MSTIGEEVLGAQDTFSATTRAVVLRDNGSGTRAINLGLIYQYFRPSSDSSDGDWLPSTVGEDLYDMIDETAADDNDYIYVTSPSTDICKIKLQALGDPLTSSNHVVSYRYRSVDATITTFKVRLVQGTTTIKEWTHSNVAPGAYVTADQTLSGAEADSITNYADLYLEFEATA